MIEQTFIDEVLAQTDLAALIGEHVTLERAGDGLKALCPFHEEKTPSFKVMPNHYHCFGCQAHGNAIDFLMNHLGMPFPRAIEHLASRLGMTVPTQTSVVRAKDPLSIVRRSLHWASEEYVRLLNESTDARAQNELERRGVSMEFAKRFSIGFAPQEWNTLTRAGRFNGSTLVKAGLAVESAQTSRSYYDLFRGRLMFPILSMSGQPLGFGGYRLGPDGAKYINTPETPLYQKSEELFGLFQAQSAIRKQDQAIIVEGYFDVLVPVQAGIENVVATCGTALTANHLRRLFSMTDNLVICLDGDSAGRKATWRIAEMILPELDDYHMVRLARMPAEHDPDSLVRAQGAGAFKEVIRTAPTLLQYLCDEFARIADYPERKARALIAAIRLWRMFSAPTLAEFFRQSLCQIFGLDDAAFYRLAGSREAPPGDKDLRYCPSCGQVSAAREHNDGQTRVVCQACGLSTRFYPSDDDARMMWNRRERRAPSYA